MFEEMILEFGWDYETIEAVVWNETSRLADYICGKL